MLKSDPFDVRILVAKRVPTNRPQVVLKLPNVAVALANPLLGVKWDVESEFQVTSRVSPHARRFFLFS